MEVEQFVMAYGAEQDRLRAILPDGFASLRPVLRINAEILNGAEGRLEFNTAVSRGETRGWLNIAHWENVPFAQSGSVTVFKTGFLEITFTGVGIRGGCPAEKDNAGCFFLEDSIRLRPPEKIGAEKEFCDCTFAWRFAGGDAHGVSLGKTLPAVPTEPVRSYPRRAFTAENAAAIPCGQVLGAYRVRFSR